MTKHDDDSERLRRRVRWTVILLVLLVLAVYIGTFVRQMQ